MKQKILSLLVLLITAASGAWAQTQITQDFENGLGDWTKANCHSNSGVINTYTPTHSGTNMFRFYYMTTPQYLISPEIDAAGGGTMSFYYARYSNEYEESFKVGYSTTTNDPTAFTWGDEVTCTNTFDSEGYLEYTYDIPAGAKYVAIACTSNDQFYLLIDDIKIEVAAADPITVEPDVEVTTNAASEGATFTEATFQMPAFDATAEYELVRDITQGVDVEVRIDGAATERIRIAKDTEGYYQFVTKQYWQFAAVDKLDNNKDLTNGEMIYSFKKKVDDDYEAVDTRYDLCPGTWRLQAEANPEKPYDGIAYGSDILLYDFKEITFPKGYSTHYYNESLVLDEICNSLKFYAVTAVTSEKVTLTEITSKAIPAQTPFIVYNETPEPITAVMGMLMADVVTSAEQFKGTAEDKNMGSQSNCYVLRNGDSTPTFRLVKGAGTLPAHRCYIDLGAAAGTRTLGFDFGDGTTDIDSVESGELKVDSYYDLQGRKRQGTPQRKGVYVKDGRKVIVR